MGAEKEEKADKYGKGVRKANKEIVENRIERTIELISLCKPTGEILSIARDEWGVCTASAEEYIRRARARIRERWNGQDRQDFIATALERMDQVAKLSIETRQMSNAIGAVNLQARLLQAISNGN